MFNIYNHSASEMSEIKDNSIDLIITSPPYNIGTEYNEYKDNLSLDSYEEILDKSIEEMSRVLNNDGILVVEIADTIMFNCTYIQLAGWFASICLHKGLSLYRRDINFINTSHGMENSEYSFDKSFVTHNNAHSNCHQILVFTKQEKQFKPEAGSIKYWNYKDDGDHPCPFPDTHLKLLDEFLEKDMKVLDPFMGTANIGQEVIKRGGYFYGYEIIEEYFTQAQQKLERAKKE